MSLRLKTVLVILIIGVVHGALNIVNQQLSVLPSFAELEEVEAVKDIQQCEAAIRQQIALIDFLAYDWAVWDDTYEFVEDANPDYIESNLPDSVFPLTPLNMVYICDTDGNLVWGKILDLESGEEIHFDEFPLTGLPPDHLLLNHAGVESSASGLVLVGEQVMMVASRPIITGDGEGPIRGAMIMGRLLDQEIVASLGEQIGIPVEARPIVDGTLTQQEQEAIAQITEDSPYYLDKTDVTSLQGYTVLPDIHGEPLLVVRASIARVIMQGGVETVWRSGLILTLVTILSLLAIFLFIEQSVVARLGKLGNFISGLAASDGLYVCTTVHGADEIGQLGNEINAMLERLQYADEELQESEERYRLLSSITSDYAGLIIVGSDGSLTAEWIVGSHKEITGRDFELNKPVAYDSTHPDDLEETQRSIAQTLDNQLTVSETRILKPDGAIVWLRTMRKPEWDEEQGRVVSFISVVQDITERKLVEEALRESEEFNQAIIEESPLGISVRNRNGRLLKYNKAWQAIWQITDEEAATSMDQERQSLTFDLKDEYLGGKQDEVGDIYKDGGSLHLPNLKTTGVWPGSAAWVSQHFNAVTDDNGEVKQVIVMTEDVTERMLAEEAREASEVQHRLLVEGMDEGIIMTTITGTDESRYSFANPAAEQIFGVGAGELVGRLTADFVTSKYQEDSLRHIAERQADEPGEYLTEITRPDGERRMLQVNAKPRHDENGEFCGSFSIFSDITERIQAEEAQRASEEKYRLLAENLTDLIWTADLTGQTTFVSPSILKFIGYTIEEGLALNIFDTVTPESAEIARDRMAQELKLDAGPDTDQNRSVTFALETIHKDNSTFWAESKVSVLRGFDGIAIGFVGISRNITERMQTEADLAASEERYKLLSAMTSDYAVSVLVDSEGDLTNEWVVGSFTEITGFGYQAGTPVMFDYIHQDDLEEFQRNLALTLSNEPTTTEYRLDRLDGTTIWLRVLRKPQWDEEQGRVVRFISVAQDITERKLAEEELHKFEHIVSNSSDMLALIDREYVYIAANPAYLDTFRKTKEEVVGHSVAEVFGQEFFDAGIKDNADRCLAGEWVHVVNWIDFPAAGRRCMDVNFSPYLGPDNKVKGIVVSGRDITGRKEAEAALLESETKYRGLFDESVAAVFTFDNEKNFTAANQAGVDLLGYSEVELLQMGIPDVDVDAKVVEPAHKEVFTGNRLVNFEHQLRRKDGRVITVLNNSRSLTDADGNVTGVQSTLLDITDRKQAEDNLRESEESLREAQGIARIGNWSWDLLTNKIDGSNQIYSMLGFETGSTPTLESIFQGISEEDQEIFSEVIVGVTKGTFKERFEFRFRNPAGETIYLVARTTAHHDDSGAIIKLVGTVQDITELKKQGEALKQSESRFRSMFELHTAVMLLVDPTTGGIVDANAAATEFYGYSLDELQAMNTQQISQLPPEEVSANQQKALDGKQDCYHFPHKVASGETKWVEVYSTPIEMQGSQLLFSIIHDITERRQAEEDLHASEERYRILVNTMGEGIVSTIADEEGKLCFSYANPAAEKLFGVEPGGLLGHSTSEFTAPGHVDKLHAEIETRRTGSISTYDLDIIRADGETRSLQITSSPRYDDQSNFIGSFSVCTDITERKQAEEDLLRSNRSLQMLGECSEALIQASEEKEFLKVICQIIVGAGGYRLAWVGFAELDELKSVYPVAQEGFEEGYLDSLEVSWADNEQGRGPTGTAIRTGEPSIARDILNDPAFAPWRDAAVKRGYASSISLPLSCAEGGFGALNIYAAELDAFDMNEVTLLREFAENVVYGLDTIRIRDKRKQAEEQLRWLGTAIQQAAETVLITDIEGTIQYVNPAFCSITGYSEEEVIGQNPRILQSGHHDGAFYQELWETISSGRPWRGRLVNRKKDGSLFYENTTISPIFDVNDRINNYVAVKRDVTHEVALEEQVRQTQKMEAIGTLAGGIAHDFNNILFAILGYAELAADDIPKGHSANDSLDQIIIAGKRAAELVKQILTFSRRTDREKRAVNVASLAKETTRMLRASLPTTIGINLRLNTAKSTINADPTEIHQVLMNLCTNAGHAMMEHGGELEIGLASIEIDELLKRQHPDLEEGSYLVLSVSDTGPGIPPEVRDKIFEPFFTTKDVGEGTGLGLAVVHGIILDLGGAIKVESEVGKGTCFKLYIPLLDAGESPGQTAASDIPGGTERVLVVDDESVIVKMMEGILQNLGYTVTAFDSSQDALAAYLRAPGDFDLVITDQTMGKLTGGDLAKEILAVEPQQPIVLVTGFSHTLPKEKAKEIGITAYVTKPVSKESLAKIVRDVLDRK